MKSFPGDGYQNSLFAPRSAWTPPDLSSLPSWAEAKRVAIDVETRDPHLKKLGVGVRRGGFVCGVSFAIEDGPSHYLPIRHVSGNLEEGKVWQYLKDQARVYTGIIVGANLPYDLDYCAENGVVFRRASMFRDVQVASPLINENVFTHSLEAIAQRWGLPGKEEDLLTKAARAAGLDPKSGISDLPSKYVGGYAERDAALPLAILRRQEVDIDEQGLWGIYDLESRLLPVLVKMRRRGVRIDLGRLAHVEKWTEEEERKNWKQVSSITGVRLTPDDAWSSNAIAAALKADGVHVFKTAKGAYSVTQEFLDNIDSKAGLHIKRARKLNKLRTTFAASVRRHLIGDRIHCTFNQLRSCNKGGEDKGAKFGRISCSDPNLQQQPSRDDFAPMWRSIYVPEPGEEWACLDYSQQEPRWTTHFASLCGLPRADEMVRRYNSDRKADNHTMMAQLIAGEGPDWVPPKKKRSQAKDLFLAQCYGQQSAAMARTLGLPTKWIETKTGKLIEVAGDEAQHIIDSFNKRLPFVRKLSKKTEAVVKRRGHIVTVLGRRCRFEKDPDGPGYYKTYRALNRLIQGSSADQTKKAMVDADDAGFRLLLQVHDEVDLSISSHREARDLAQIMREAVTMKVQSRVDIEVGPNWGEIKGISE